MPPLAVPFPLLLRAPFTVTTDPPPGGRMLEDALEPTMLGAIGRPFLLGCLLLLALCSSSASRAALDPAQLAGFAGDFQSRLAAVEALGVASGDDAGRTVTW